MRSNERTDPGANYCFKLYCTGELHVPLTRGSPVVCADGGTDFMSAAFARSLWRARFMNMAPRVSDGDTPGGLPAPTFPSPAGSLASDGATLETADGGALLADNLLRHYRALRLGSTALTEALSSSLYAGPVIMFVEPAEVHKT